MRMLVIILSFIVGFISTLGLADAQTVLSPDGLELGDMYRIAFVTDGVIDATSSLVSTYNDFVASEVNNPGSILAGLQTQWSAIVSTAEIDAIENTETDPSSVGDTGVPIFLADGITRIVPNYDVMWSGVVGFRVLEAPISITQFGDRSVKSIVWSGTSLQGVAQAPLGEAVATHGFQVSSNSRWIANGGHSNTTLGQVYGLSGVLVAVPEPTSVLLLASGSIGAVFRRRR